MGKITSLLHSIGMLDDCVYVFPEAIPFEIAGKIKRYLTGASYVESMGHASGRFALRLANYSATMASFVALGYALSGNADSAAATFLTAEVCRKVTNEIADVFAKSHHHYYTGNTERNRIWNHVMDNTYWGSDIRKTELYKAARSVLRGEGPQTASIEDVIHEWDKGSRSARFEKIGQDTLNSPEDIYEKIVSLRREVESVSSLEYIDAKKSHPELYKSIVESDALVLAVRDAEKEKDSKL